MVKQLCALGIGLGLFVQSAYAVNPDKEFADFFARYDQLSNADDPASAALYADDARVKITRLSPDGIERSMAMAGKKLKELYLENIDTIRKMGAKSSYSYLKINRKGDTAKITATRYDNLECFSDPNYYMVVSRKADKKLYITEEYSESSEQSFCKQGLKDSLALQLALGASMVSKNLPMQVDPDTQLERVEAKDKTITFTYRMLHFARAELNDDKISMDVVPQIVQQGCQNPGMRKMLDQGALMHLNYIDREAKPITQINLTQKDCV